MKKIRKKYTPNDKEKYMCAKHKDFFKGLQIHSQMTQTRTQHLSKMISDEVRPYGQNTPYATSV